MKAASILLPRHRDIYNVYLTPQATFRFRGVFLFVDNISTTLVVAIFRLRDILYLGDKYRLPQLNSFGSVLPVG